MKIKKIILSIFLITIIAVIIAVLVVARNKIKRNSDKIQIVTSNFSCYDFLRHIL